MTRFGMWIQLKSYALKQWRIFGAIWKALLLNLLTNKLKHILRFITETDGNIGIVSKTPIPRAVVSVFGLDWGISWVPVSVSVSVEPPAPVFGSYATIPY